MLTLQYVQTLLWSIIYFNAQIITVERSYSFDSGNAHCNIVPTVEEGIVIYIMLTIIVIIVNKGLSFGRILGILCENSFCVLLFQLLFFWTGWGGINTTYFRKEAYLQDVITRFILIVNLLS